jgi:hypothetical protein
VGLSIERIEFLLKQSSLSDYYFTVILSLFSHFCAFNDKVHFFIPRTGGPYEKNNTKIVNYLYFNYRTDTSNIKGPGSCL